MRTLTLFDRPGSRRCYGGIQTVVVALALAMALCFSAGRADARSAVANGAPAEPAPIAIGELETAADLAAAYLVAQIQPDGSFRYRINLNPQHRSAPKYNWLRHAGTVYSLADYHQRTGNTDVLPVIGRAITLMRVLSMAPVISLSDTLAIWTDGDLTGADGPFAAKLGAAGLALVAMSALEEIAPGTVPKAELDGLARFVVAMQKPEGAFYSKYIPSQGGRSDEWISLYYPGEAALGMTMLYDRDGNAAWLESARKALRFLSESRKGQANVPADHWALIATQRMWPHLDNEDRELVWHHARQIVEVILAEQVWSPGTVVHGGYAADGRTTPTATRLEGLLAAEFLFRDEPEFHRRIMVSMSWGMHFLLGVQIKEGPFAGAVPRAIAFVEDTGKAARTFNRRATEVRIDYVQHALSAYIQYRDLIAEMN